MGEEQREGRNKYLGDLIAWHNRGKYRANQKTLVNV